MFKCFINSYNFQFVHFTSDVAISFSQLTYEFEEGTEFAPPELMLSDPLDCCSTISVYVNVEEISTDGTYIIIMMCSSLCFYRSEGMNMSALIVTGFVKRDLIYTSKFSNLRFA